MAPKDVEVGDVPAEREASEALAAGRVGVGVGVGGAVGMGGGVGVGGVSR